ncbi:hypothetical protein BABINDRAFT_170936 [Babjeviella inositovora NRRL Y-12698]|uniref:DNA mismatch repair protein S5 domain-containing protein n=1 Tax=Babjeviella inositovora NRRL Y-12698 TaxID=984486 RepID=A0A1E3QS42_9ASCO|nr:uncharacterized protein BABINDRAFT_170936 [Babjeviella inositovora NRRL Y-12698]ODQ80501.1 hypothetical protein BABINDRAFT_170936 [Babjeviella inositovora NRRL Y-12698]
MSVDQPGRIKALDTNVVNKIAAGEIIIAPANALKEILENSIDAQSTTIEVSVKEGGLKQLQITDNGHGINKDDLAILCERFTTSKLSTFKDLSTIQTYGFRGEALASISHISHLSVVTKTKDSPVAYKCVYASGKLAPTKKGANPQAVAGKDGTQIVVEDLFYNVPSRLRSIRSPSDEYYKILDVVQKYSIHCLQAGFMVKKTGESNYALMIRQNLSLKERIRTIYGSGIANELLEFNETEAGERYGLVAFSVCATSPNFSSSKKTPPIFFINNRLVSCDPLRKSLQQVYAAFLPKGANHPFIYLSLSISPENVDVNVHPTKREVRFLHEDEIIELVTERVQEELMKTDNSRVFHTQSVLPMKRTEPEISTPVKRLRQESKLVRIDSSQVKISTFLASGVHSTSLEGSQLSHNVTGETQDDSRSSNSVEGETQDGSRPSNTIADETQDTEILNSTVMDTTLPVLIRIPYTTDFKRHRTNIRLASLAVLKSAAEVTAHEPLTKMLQNCQFIGVVDATKRLCVFQEDVRLFMCDYGSLCYHLFYQIGLAEFGNFGSLTLTEQGGDILPELEPSGGETTGLSVRQLLAPVTEGDLDSLISQLVNMREMFEEYFSIKIEEFQGDVRLVSVPLMMRHYNPSVSKLGLFLLRLCTKVDYTDEQTCFEDILKQVALFYIPPVAHAGLDDEEQEAYQLQMHSILEGVVFPAIKKGFLAPESMLRDVVEIANLPGLYKVFERC